MRSAFLCGLTLLTGALAYPADGPTFEVASVKLADPNVRPSASLFTGGPGTSDAGHFRAPAVNMLLLLRRAFGVGLDQIAGDWVKQFKATNLYSIEAVVPPGSTEEQFQKMLQNLLIERFRLKFKRETRDYPAYELVVDKAGPKFKEVTASRDQKASQPTTRAAELSAPVGSDGFPNIPGPRTFTQSNSGIVRQKYQERTMDFIAANLGFLLWAYGDRTSLTMEPRIKNKTGLTGIYTFVLEFSGGASSVRRPQGLDAPLASDPRGPSIFDALQKQLGLRLEKTTAIPVEVIVVQAIDEVPTQN